MQTVFTRRESANRTGKNTKFYLDVYDFGMVICTNPRVELVRKVAASSGGGSSVFFKTKEFAKTITK